MINLTLYLWIYPSDNHIIIDCVWNQNDNLQQITRQIQINYLFNQRYKFLQRIVWRSLILLLPIYPRQTVYTSPDLKRIILGHYSACLSWRSDGNQFLILHVRLGISALAWCCMYMKHNTLPILVRKNIVHTLFIYTIIYHCILKETWNRTVHTFCTVLSN